MKLQKLNSIDENLVRTLSSVVGAFEEEELDEELLLQSQASREEVK